MTNHREANPVLIHGDNTFKSREKLGTVIDQIKAQSIEITRLDAPSLSLNDLENALLSNTLFGHPETILIEELHSLPTSSRKKELLTYCSEYLLKQSTDPESYPKQLILWEKRLLTKTMLKPFMSVGVEIFEYKISSLLFKWLESLTPEKSRKTSLLVSLQKVLSQENEFVIFSMLSRQIRLLLEIKSGSVPKVEPFLVSRLKKQAGLFTEQQLLVIHKKLVQIDTHVKTSGSHLSLAQQLDLLVLKM
jgi:DNA polymerase III delta subunit